GQFSQWGRGRTKACLVASPGKDLVLEELVELRGPSGQPRDLHHLVEARLGGGEVTGAYLLFGAPDQRDSKRDQRTDLARKVLDSAPPCVIGRRVGVALYHDQAPVLRCSEIYTDH